MTFAEDTAPIRIGPHVLACLPSLAIGVLSRAGPVNLATTLRHHSRDHTDRSPPLASGSMKRTTRKNDGALRVGRLRVALDVDRGRQLGSCEARLTPEDPSERLG